MSTFLAYESYLLYNVHNNVLLVSGLPEPVEKPADAPFDWTPPPTKKADIHTQSYEKGDPLPTDIPGALFKITQHPSVPGAFQISNTATKLPLTRDALKVDPVFDSTIDSDRHNSHAWSILPVDAVSKTYVISNLDTRGLDANGKPYWFLTKTTLRYGPLRIASTAENAPVPPAHPTYTFGSSNIAPTQPDRYTWVILTYSEASELAEPPPILQKLLVLILENPTLLYAVAGLGMLLLVAMGVLILNRRKKSPTRLRRMGR